MKRPVAVLGILALLLLTACHSGAEAGGGVGGSAPHPDSGLVERPTKNPVEEPEEQPAESNLPQLPAQSPAASPPTPEEEKSP